MNEKFVETKNTMPTSCVLSAYYTDASMKLSRNFGCVPPSLPFHPRDVCIHGCMYVNFVTYTSDRDLKYREREQLERFICFHWLSSAFIMMNLEFSVKVVFILWPAYKNVKCITKPLPPFSIPQAVFFTRSKNRFCSHTVTHICTYANMNTRLLPTQTPIPQIHIYHT